MIPKTSRWILYIMQNCKVRCFAEFMVRSYNKSWMGNLILNVTPTLEFSFCYDLWCSVNVFWVAIVDAKYSVYPKVNYISWKNYTFIPKRILNCCIVFKHCSEGISRLQLHWNDFWWCFFVFEMYWFSIGYTWCQHKGICIQ